MPRETVPLQIDDLSRFARTLASELDDPPSHLTLMNMLARSAGYRNFQHLRADAVAQNRLDTPKADAEPIDHRRVEKALGHFDDLGRLERWPSRNAMQKLVVWVFWADLEVGESLSEAEVNDRFDEQHRFRSAGCSSGSVGSPVSATARRTRASRRRCRPKRPS